jgi:hypothetical protein
MTIEYGKIQKDLAFKRGKNKSSKLCNLGSIQFPNPPIKVGITIKKIITKACLVTVTL